MIDLTVTQIKYLLTLYELHTEKNGAITRGSLTGIAAKLNVTKPSAHHMMTQLQDFGLIEIQRGVPHFTECGILLAGEYAAMYQTILSFLTANLQMDVSHAEKNAIALLGSGEAGEMCRCIKNYSYVK